MSASSSTPSSGPAPVYSPPTSEIPPPPITTSDPHPTPSPPPLPFHAPSPPTSLPPPPCHPSAPPFTSTPRSRMRSRTPPLSLRPPLNASIIPLHTRRRHRHRRSAAHSPITAASRLALPEPAPYPWSMPRPSLAHRSPPPSDSLPNASPLISSPRPPRPLHPSPYTQDIPLPRHSHIPSQPPLQPRRSERNMFPLPNPHPPPVQLSQIPSTSQHPHASNIPPHRTNAIDELIAVLEGRVTAPSSSNHVISRSTPSNLPNISPNLQPSPHRIVSSSHSNLPPQNPPFHPNPVPGPAPLMHSSVASAPRLANLQMPPTVQPGPRQPAPQHVTSFVPITMPVPPPSRLTLQDHPPSSPRFSDVPPHDPRGMWPPAPRHSLLQHQPLHSQPNLPPLTTASVPPNPFHSTRPVPQAHPRLPRTTAGRGGLSAPSRLPLFPPPPHRNPADLALAAEWEASFAQNTTAFNLVPPGQPHSREQPANSAIFPGGGFGTAGRHPAVPRYTPSSVGPSAVGPSANAGSASTHGGIGRRAVSFSIPTAEETHAAERARMHLSAGAPQPTGEAGIVDEARSANMSRFLRLAGMNASRRPSQVSDDLRVIFGNGESAQAATGGPGALESGVQVGPGSRQGLPNFEVHTYDAVRRFMLAEDDNDVTMGDPGTEGLFLQSLHGFRSRGRGGYPGMLASRGRGRFRAMRIPRAPGESMLRRAEVRAMVAGREFGVPCGLFEYSVRGRPSLTPNIEWPDVILISDENVKPRAPILDIMSADGVQWCVRVGPLGNGEGEGRRGYLGFVHGLIEGGFAIELNVQGGCIYLWALSFPPYGECLLGVFRPEAAPEAAPEETPDPDLDAAPHAAPSTEAGS